MLLDLITLEDTLTVPIKVDNGSTPTNADSAPTYRVYGPSGFMAAGSLSTFQDTATNISGATNANPIVVTTSAAHNLNNGTRVTITGVVGNTAANTSAQVANKTDTTFEMSGVAGNGSYTSGGTWNVSGLYAFSLACTAAAGFEAGKAYSVFVTAVVSGTTRAWTYRFKVV